MLRLLSRRKPVTPTGSISSIVADSASTPSIARQPSLRLSVEPEVEPTRNADASVRLACALSACAPGSRATILEVRCGDADACRLRALGLCEGASVSVVRSRDTNTLLEIHGSRLAVGSSIAAGIMVMPAI